MSEAPKLIWLQRPNKDSMSEFFGEVTWCEDKQNDDDTCYFKAGMKSIAIAEEFADLRARLEKAETIADAARNLIAQKGRHNTAIAYKRLAEVIAERG